ncbi:MAG TPA: hypothetical protein VFJ74_01320 [Gemmatimonadaceae bacterium]|nr:hypothetical protein [Gemmatimonadaceae bacterium]
MTLTTSRLSAQEVTPAVASVIKAAPGTNYSASFTVSNTNLVFGSATADTFALTCTRSGVVSACRGAPATVVIARGGGTAATSTSVALSYDLSGPGGGTLGLVAKVVSSGTPA